MLAALLYLRLTSAQNWVLSRVRRLRQPKYLFGALVGAAYVWFFVLRRLAMPPPTSGNFGRHGGFPIEMMSVSALLVQVIVVMAVGRVIMAWMAPDKPGLVFTEPEIAFLFPAPIARNALIHFKLLSSQLTILLSAGLLAIISNRWNSLGGNPFTHAVGWWIIFSAINLHSIGAAFTVSRLVDYGISRTLRRAVVFSVFAGLLLAIGYAAWQTLPPPTESDISSPNGLIRYISQATDSGALHWLLLPVRMIAGPFLAPTWPAFFAALGPAVALLALHYLWVMRTATSFEEASIALAEKRARAVEARSGQRVGRAPMKPQRGRFPLSSAGGRPEVAFLWKNLLSTRPFFNHRTFLFVAVLIVVSHRWFADGTPMQRTALGIVGTFGLIFAGYTLVLGPQFARQDLRGDLANVDLLKTYPLRGWQVVLGELLTPMVLLTAVMWLGLLAAALNVGRFGTSSAMASVPLRITVACCVGLIAPVVCLLQLMVPNAATILFPSWAQATRSRDRGIEMIGQRLIFVGGQLAVILCALLPAALFGLLLGFASHFVLNLIGATIAAAAGFLSILLVEVCLGLWWLGGRFERFDLSSESVNEPHVVD